MEQELVRLRRNDHFFQQQLEHVRERLRQSREEPEEGHAIRSAAQLHPADDLTLDQREERHRQNQHHRDDEGPDGGRGRSPAASPTSLPEFVTLDTRPSRQYVAAGVRPSRVFCSEGARRTSASIWYIGRSSKVPCARPRHRSPCGCPCSARRPQEYPPSAKRRSHSRRRPHHRPCAARRAHPPTTGIRSRRDSTGCPAPATPSNPGRDSPTGSAAPAWLCHSPSMLTYVPEVSANVPIGRMMCATLRNESFTNGVSATTNSAFDRARGAFRVQRVSPGLDATDQHVGFQRLLQHFRRGETRSSAAGLPPASRCGTAPAR